ncbi:phage tail tape measure protein [Microbacterium luteolum]|uniref:Phage tail tape measure protein n=1 Tax=Microbacterium luteolum TaxID=69367 RepID=A0ABY7XRL5_MICLT|nr:phage tail tape measure protein [Microbacterium luteolum]WDM42518.1 phage tail tape measure protein [Microbacterium luteolum]
MTAFDAGSLVFKLQTLGAQIFSKDQSDAKKAVEETGRAAQTSAGQVDKLGSSTDATGKKSKDTKAPLDEQAKSTRKVGDENATADPKIKQTTASAEQQIAAAKQLSAALLGAGAAVAAMVTLSVVKFTEFDQGMSNVRAATTATSAEQKQLGEAALQAGADTAYSASEAAAAQEELAKAGQSVSEIVGGSLNGALALAAAGQLQVARSAEIMATTLTQFGLTADSSGHVADVLAAGAGKAQGSVDDLALALQYVGPLANQAGWSLDETAGTLAYFATQGVLGEKAGTSLRGVLASLQSPSALAKSTMEQYGLSIYDASGNMLTASQVAGNMQKAFSSLTQEERNAALGRIFGNESLLAATLLYEGGADAISHMTDEVNDSAYAAEQARIRQDNLAGDVEKLGGAFDTALIRTGSGANDVLREMTQAVTELVDSYGDMPEPVQAVTIGIGVAAAAMLLFAGGAVGTRAKFLELKAALVDTNVTMGKTALVGAGAGLALTGIITVLGLLMAKQAEARQKAQAYADTLEDGTNRVTKATRDLVKENLAAADSFLWFNSPSAFDKAEDLGLSLGRITDAAMGNVEALKELKEAQEEYQAAYDRDRESGDASSADDLRLQNINAVIDAVNGENASIDESIRKAEQKKKSDEESAESSRTAGEAYMEVAGDVEEVNNQLSQLIDKIMASNDANLDAREANRQLIDAFVDFDEVLARNGATLDLNTEAGRENEAALDKIAEKAMTVAESTTAAGGSYDDYRASLESSRQQLLDRIHDLGVQGDEAEALADKILKIPAESEWKMIADAYTAQATIDQFIITNSGKKIPIKIIADGSSFKLPDFGGRVIDSGGLADGGVVSYHANGSVSENHVAQFARAGEWRVWAEDETGGEAYIPLAPSKRARSEAIMAETAERLGGTYIPSSAQHQAVGSVMAPSGGTGRGVGRGNMTHIDKVENNFVVPTSDPELAAHYIGRELGLGIASS